MKVIDLKNLFIDCTSEEELKHKFAKHFKIKLNTKHKIDLYTHQVLFEFKLNENFSNLSIRAKVIAQALYYIRKLKYGNFVEVPSKFICGIDKNSAFIIESAQLKNYYLKSSRKNYDWDLAPSNPCKKLVADLTNDDSIINLHVYHFNQPEDNDNFIIKIKSLLTEQTKLFDEKKEINEDNFYEVFLYWQSLFGSYVENGRKPSEYFITDIEYNKSEIIRDKQVLFITNNNSIIKNVPINEYKYFWSQYEKISDPRIMIAIRQKMDRMSEIELRRFTGEFFTPINFAKKALEYLERVVGVNWYKSGEFRLWDMASGTGNLEFVLPSEALQYCYISTLLEDDAKYCKKIFPTSTVFQYDYLNDDIDFLVGQLQYSKPKMPKQLIDDLNNPNLKWIIFFNPPYATANNFERDKSKINKDKVSMTAVRDLMTKNNLGNVSQELSSQFLYRINLQFKNRHAYIGMFSKIKYINSNIDERLRDKFFDYKFESGFVFSSKNFQGCKGKFPVGFVVWNMFNHKPLTQQKISLDVFNDNLEKFAVKKIHTENDNKFLNKWINRPSNVNKFPPMSSALTIYDGKYVRCDRVAENFLSGFICVSNDFLHQNWTSFLPGAYWGGSGMSITPENFEQAMIVHMVRRLPKATWLNDRDQFMQPTKNLPTEFINDSVIWSLFANSNNTTAISDVEYEGKIYQIQNNFYPFKLEELINWNCADFDIAQQIYLANIRNDDRFVAKWIAQHEFSPEAQQVIDSARLIYQNFYAKLDSLDKSKFKISTWDAGWYQIRMSLNVNLSTEMKLLGEKLLPQIYELGFLQDEVIYL